MNICATNSPKRLIISLWMKCTQTETPKLISSSSSITWCLNRSQVTSPVVGITFFIWIFLVGSRVILLSQRNWKLRFKKCFFHLVDPQCHLKYTLDHNILQLEQILMVMVTWVTECFAFLKLEPRSLNQTWKLHTLSSFLFYVSATKIHRNDFLCFASMKFRPNIQIEKSSLLLVNEQPN